MIYLSVANWLQVYGGPLILLGMLIIWAVIFTCHIVFSREKTYNESKTNKS